MIKPHRFLNLESSVLYLGAKILNHLKQNGAIKYDELFDLIAKDKLSEKSKSMFIPTLNFLYLLGKIDYNQDLDAFELKL